MVAIVGAVAMVFTFGTPLSYGIFREPFSDVFGISSIALSVVFAIMLFTFFIGSGLVGVFGARFRARAVLLACSIATGVLAPALYLTGSIGGLIVVFAVLGLALGTVFVLVASVIPRWFERRRGVATGLIFVGNGLGLFVLPPIWQYALATVGVRRGFLIIMSVTAVAFLLAALVCRRPQWADQSTATAGELLEWLARLGGTRTFQLLFLGMALSFAWYQLLAAYAVDLFVARGLTAAGASTAFGLIGGVSIISRIGSGFLADVMGSRRAFLASLVCAAIGIALLFVPVLSVLLVAIFLIGLGLGGTATLYIPLLMGIYSPEKDTAIVGVFNVAIGVAALAMPPLGTASVAYTGSFTIAIVLTVVATGIGFWTIAVGTARS
ncbi:MFS transporter [Natronorubrum thiooxidans]|uniref:Predicted arabinose efflux permease, MFS family n=1 Tax=Natronorubrum thiooxidans TaxID=308853 RepID=A0A1N7H5W6_9EURY|nr:MFS transporter [Natronorubrum thiooxidans]SIS20173.1 Predicted arabinose efflux permease, MFS family [Natronorubrum thiooxidans]